ncbi:hypothetical protein, partial [Agromyces aerolatus]
MAATPEFATVDDYLASFPPERVVALQSVRDAIHRGVGPDAEERIRYDLPAIMLGGRYAIHLARATSRRPRHPPPPAPPPAARATLRHPHHLPPP